MFVKVIHVKIMEPARKSSIHLHANACQAGLEQNVKQVNRYAALMLQWGSWNDSLNWRQQFSIHKRSGFWLEKISILRVLKKKRWTHHSFLHRGPKKAVEHDSDIHFDLT